MAADLHPERRVCHENLGNRVELNIGAGLKPGAAGSKGDVLQHHGGPGGRRRRLCWGGVTRHHCRLPTSLSADATGRVDRGTHRSSGAPVETVEDTISVLVTGAAERVYRGALRRI